MGVPKIKGELAWVNPALALQWHTTKNGDLTPHDVTPGSGKKVWWRCSEDAKHEWEAVIAQRSRGTGCPFCSGHRASHTNNLTVSFPDIAKKWHPTKNGELKATDVTYASKKKVWWVEADGSAYQRVVRDEVQRKGTKTVLPMYELWGNYPDIVDMMADKANRFRYGVSSSEKIDWICPKCNEIVRKKAITNVRGTGLACPHCSDGKSYPEKFMLSLLKEAGIEFENEVVFPWNPRKRYDFYIPSRSLIIEMHGIQHYEDVFRFQDKRDRTLQGNQQNDQEKKAMALKHGILHYVVIDARKSSPLFIRESVRKSALLQLLGLKDIELDWQAIFKQAENSLVVDVNQLWKDGVRTLNHIAEQLSISRYTVRKYLKRGKAYGWNDYSEAESQRKFFEASTNRGGFGSAITTKDVVRIEASGAIQVYKSVREAAYQNGIKSTSDISKACKDTTRTAKGYKWMHRTAYEEIVRERPTYDFSWDKASIYRSKHRKELVQLTMNHEFVACWESLSQAASELNIASTTFSKCAKGTRKSVGGYKWMYREDYEKTHPQLIT